MPTKTSPSSVPKSTCQKVVLCSSICSSDKREGELFRCMGRQLSRVAQTAASRPEIEGTHALFDYFGRRCELSCVRLSPSDLCLTVATYLIFFSLDNLRLVSHISVTSQHGKCKPDIILEACRPSSTAESRRYCVDRTQSLGAVTAACVHEKRVAVVKSQRSLPTGQYVVIIERPTRRRQPSVTTARRRRGAVVLPLLLLSLARTSSTTTAR